MNGVSNQYLIGSNRLLQYGTQAITTDAAGQITAIDGYTLQYNGDGRLYRILDTQGAELVRYRYNHSGLRTEKVINGNTTTYLYDLAGRLIGESTGTGLSRSYLYVGDAPIAQITTGDVLTYLHTDHLGSPRIGTNEAGNVVWRWNGEAFGMNQPSTNIRTVNLRFPGQYFDTETGFHYNGHRYYDPDIGRYLTSDPIGIAGGVNTYAYVGNNPVNAVDPLGLDAIYINYEHYPVTTPLGKLPLGHGAVVSVDPNSGDTKYYEFGRYDDDNGVVRSGKIPNVSIGTDGLPTEESLNHLYDFLSHNFGHDVLVTGTYYPNSDYKGTINFAEQFKRQHQKYDLLNNNCKTFGRSAAAACQEGSSCKY